MSVVDSACVEKHSQSLIFITRNSQPLIFVTRKTVFKFNICYQKDSL